MQHLVFVVSYFFQRIVFSPIDEIYMADGSLNLITCTRAWHNTVCEGGGRFMAAWLRGEETGPERRQCKRGAEDMDKIEVAPGVAVGSFKRFGAALVGPTEGLPKRRRLRR